MIEALIKALDESIWADGQYKVEVPGTAYQLFFYLQTESDHSRFVGLQKIGIVSNDIYEQEERYIPYAYYDLMEGIVIMD